MVEGREDDKVGDGGEGGGDGDGGAEEDADVEEEDDEDAEEEDVEEAVEDGGDEEEEARAKTKRRRKKAAKAKKDNAGQKNKAGSESEGAGGSKAAKAAKAAEPKAAKPKAAKKKTSLIEWGDTPLLPNGSSGSPPDAPFSHDNTGSRHFRQPTQLLEFISEAEESGEEDGWLAQRRLHPLFDFDGFATRRHADAREGGLKGTGAGGGERRWPSPVRLSRDARDDGSREGGSREGSLRRRLLKALGFVRR